MVVTYPAEGLAATPEEEAVVVPDEEPLQIGRHDGVCNVKKEHVNKIYLNTGILQDKGRTQGQGLPHCH